MGHQLCVKKILNNHWISGVPILNGLIRLLKRLKFCLVNTETTVKIIWSSEATAFIKVSHHAIPRSVNRFVHLSVGLKIRHNISYMKGTSG